MWKLATLRADVAERWGDRLDLTQTVVAGRVRQELRSLRDDTNHLLGTVEIFHPRTVIEDPGDLKGTVKEVLRLFKLMDRLPTRYDQLLRLGPWLLSIVATLCISVILVFGHLSGVMGSPATLRIGLLLLSMAVVAGLIGFVSYLYLQNYLSSAESEFRSSADPIGD